MTASFKIHVARRTADSLGARARKLRRDLRDHYRSESFRILQNEKRARGLRLYAAWSRQCPRAPVSDREFHPNWCPAESEA